MHARVRVCVRMRVLGEVLHQLLSGNAGGTAVRPSEGGLIAVKVNVFGHVLRNKSVSPSSLQSRQSLTCAISRLPWLERPSCDSGHPRWFVCCPLLGPI